MHPMLTIAVKAAREAGRIINRASQDVNALSVQSKTFNDFVSEVDHAAEQAIISVMRILITVSWVKKVVKVIQNLKIFGLLTHWMARQISYITFHNTAFPLPCSKRVCSHKR
jgi:hypothetical protein